MPDDRGWGADQVATNRMEDRFHPRMCPEFLIDAMEMIPQCLRRDLQLARNLCGTPALRETRKDAEFLL